MHTSARGITFIERHEGVVLKAYRCPAGRWTIGAGLTSASGVIDPKPGMVISRARASDLLAKALRGNYEPAVAAEMPGARQNEFDGGTSFHVNTGAIGRASWVKRWWHKDWPEVERRIKLWNKGGGKVLPGLVRRREEEFSLIRHGIYEGEVVQVPASGLARVVVPMSPDEIAAAQVGFRSLGYNVGQKGFVKGSIVAFQADHDLTIDGIVGRATLATLQRRLDAARKAKTATGGTAAGAVGAESASLASAPIPDWLLWLVLAGGLVWLGWLAFTYRDALAVKLQGRWPGLASRLRSF